MLASVISLMMMATSSLSLLTVPIVHAEELTKDDYIKIATQEAKEHHLKVDRFLKTIECESNWVATSTGALGELGLAQIYPKYHPELTKKQMLNPIFSIAWMAEQWENDHYSWWSCWSLLYD